MNRLTQVLCAVSALGSVASVAAFYTISARHIDGASTGLVVYLFFFSALVLVPYIILFGAAWFACTLPASSVAFTATVIAAGIATFVYSYAFEPTDGEFIFMFALTPGAQALVAVPALVVSLLARARKRHHAAL